ncbi:MAG: CSLREA domain-containing protein [Anaerolineales bacterium]|nr:CSLREA domain-containing protein [Anaerolineales bacterium]MDW8162998.1 CSLREA domain-containing protein [Anaerolineales bacterium]
MKNPIFRLLLTLLMVALLLSGQGAQPASAATYTVNSLADTISDNDLCTLREAMHAADNNPQNNDCGLGSSADDRISFSVTGTIALTSPLPPISSVQGRLDIDGGGNITISGDQNNDNTPDHQMFYVNPGAYLSLASLTLTKGNGGAVGGAVTNQGILVVNQTTFSNHLSTGNGGAIANLSNGEAYLYTSTFSLNQANNVGGAIDNSGKMLVSESRFNGNSANTGGGAIFNEKTLFVDKSAFSSNLSNNGGAIENSNASSELTIHRSTFVGNIALTGAGGGIFVPVGKFTLVNSTFSNNSAATQGGGVYSAGTTIVANSTLSGNSAANGGGVFVFAGSTTLKNTLVANSTGGGDCKGTLSGTTQYNFIEDSGANACGLINGANWNIIGQDPNLGTMSGSPAYFPLLPGSPAIDAGDNTTCADEELAENGSQNGVTRPKDGDGDNAAICDIGAYERTLQAQSYQVNTLDDNTNNDSFCTLREAILAANDAPANSNCGVGGGGDDTIEFSVSGVIRIASTLPNIVSGQGKLRIDSNQSISVNGDSNSDFSGDVRVFWVDSGAHLILEELTVEYGNAKSNEEAA